MQWAHLQAAHARVQHLETQLDIAQKAADDQHTATASLVEELKAQLAEQLDKHEALLAAAKSELSVMQEDLAASVADKELLHQLDNMLQQLVADGTGNLQAAVQGTPGNPVACLDQVCQYLRQLEASQQADEDAALASTSSDAHAGILEAMQQQVSQ